MAVCFPRFTLKISHALISFRTEKLAKNSVHFEADLWGRLLLLLFFFLVYVKEGDEQTDKIICGLEYPVSNDFMSDLCWFFT